MVCYSRDRPLNRNININMKITIINRFVGSPSMRYAKVFNAFMMLSGMGKPVDPIIILKSP